MSIDSAAQNERGRRAQQATVPVACNRDCGGGCPLVATVEDGRVTRIASNPAGGPFLKGCIRGYRAMEQLYASDSPAAPLVRTGPRGSGQFREVGWPEAVQTVADGLAAVRDRARRRRRARARRVGLVPRRIAQHRASHGALSESLRRSRRRGGQLQLGGREFRGACRPGHGRGRHGRGHRPALRDDRAVGLEPGGLHHGLRVAGAGAPGQTARCAGRGRGPASHRDRAAARHRVAAGASRHR